MRYCLFCPLLFAAFTLAVLPASAQLENGISSDLRPDEGSLLADHQEPWDLAPRAAAPCVGGVAAGYPCENVDLLSFLPLASIGGGNGNDVWGWTDPQTGHEYALAGRTTGTAFVDVTDGANPIYLGNLPTHSSNSTWRDIKVYGNYAFIVSEATDHGLQVFDLTRLRNVPSPPVTFTEDAHYSQFGRAHNLVINEESGFAYAVGSRQGTTQCQAGLHMVDIHNPLAPTFAGCFSSDGYTHDAQCVNYSGPDADHAGQEVCFASNEDTLTIVNVSNKSAPAQISRTGYTGNGYTHQGWLTEDRRFFLVDDELDESNFGHNTKTYVWNVQNLDAPQLIGTFFSPTAAIDHNQYVKGNFVYQANYRSGLRILSLADVASGQLSQVGYFDIYPPSDSASFNGSWSTFPYFASGNVLINGIEQGLFVVHPNLCSAPPTPDTFTATANGANQVDLAWTATGAPPGTQFRVERAFGACGSSGFETLATVSVTTYSDTAASGTIPNSYRVVAESSTAGCASQPSACAQATPAGACTAYPAFGGVSTVTSAGTPTCALTLAWSAATPRCGSGVTYNVYRSTTPGTPPSPSHRIASGLTATSFLDGSVVPDTAYVYIVRAVDATTGVEDTNLVERSATPTGPLADGIWQTGAEFGDPILNGRTVSIRHAGWHPDDERVRSGERSYAVHFDPNLCSGLISSPLALSAGQAPQLSFWSSFEMGEEDGGAVEISTDDGATWTPLPLLGASPGGFPTAANACGFPAGTPGITGSREDWGHFNADLSPWAGSTVQLRWIFSTDSGDEPSEGWFIDDVALTHAQVASVCTAGPIFTDGFESGGTGAWALTVP